MDVDDPAMLHGPSRRIWIAKAPVGVVQPEIPGVHHGNSKHAVGGRVSSDGRHVDGIVVGEIVIRRARNYNRGCVGDVRAAQRASGGERVGIDSVGLVQGYFGVADLGHLEGAVRVQVSGNVLDHHFLPGSQAVDRSRGHFDGGGVGGAGHGQRGVIRDVHRSGHGAGPNHSRPGAGHRGEVVHRVDGEIVAPGVIYDEHSVRRRISRDSRNLDGLAIGQTVVGSRYPDGGRRRRRRHRYRGPDGPFIKGVEEILVDHRQLHVDGVAGMCAAGVDRVHRTVENVSARHIRSHRPQADGSHVGQPQRLVNVTDAPDAKASGFRFDAWLGRHAPEGAEVGFLLDYGVQAVAIAADVRRRE